MRLGRLVTRRPRTLTITLALLLVAIVMAAGLLVTLWQRVERLDLRLHASPDGGTTFLLVGTDSRAFIRSEEDRTRYGSPEDNPGTGADVMLLVRALDDETHLLSISRDLIVVDEESLPLRVTAALNSGPQELLDTLCRSLGLGVDHYLQIDFAGLREIVNSIGRIEVVADNATRDEWSGLRLEPGLNRLDGDGVLQYVASRRPEILVDGQWIPGPRRSRGDKAAEVLGKIGDRLDLSPLSPISSYRRLSAIADAISVGDSFGVRDALALRSRLQGLDSEQIVELPTAPLEGSDDLLPIEGLEPRAAQVLVEFDGPEPADGCAPRLPEAQR